PFWTFSSPSGFASVLSFSLFIFQGAACPRPAGVTLKREFQSIMNFRQSQAVFTKKFKKFYLHDFSTCFQPLNTPFQAGFQQFQQFYVENNFSAFRLRLYLAHTKKKKFTKLIAIRTNYVILYRHQLLISENCCSLCARSSAG
ncbi:hypothetical protein, partial [Anaerotruncus colihominis]|uniref:hypothetical protein n=1 Tax=Anaerotruncus colihominis TaxID=169435 RepID=UPI00242E18B3